jgi:hypothetical protein
MAAGTSRKVSRAVRVVLALVALSAVISVRAAEQPAPAAADDALRRQVEARFEVVPLRDGIALAGRTADRRIEIDRGVVLSRGVPLSGDELRRRFGADADLVLRLSYLDNDTLRRLFAAAPASSPSAPAPPPVAPPPAAAAPAPPTAPSTPPAPPVFDRPSPDEARPVFHRTGARLGIAKPIVVAADEEVTDGVFSLGGSVRIDGRVREGVVVVGSDLTLAPTADVRGDITVVGGTLSIAEGARHAGAVHHAEGASWPRWSWPTVGWSWFEPGGAASWLPLAGTTTRILLLAIAMAGLAFFARARVSRIGAAAVANPLRAGLIGLAAQAIFVPALIVVAIVMAITIVGLPFVAVVVPLAVLAMLATMVLGFTSLAARLGQHVTGNDTVVAVLAGLVIIVLPTFLARLAGIGPDALRAVTVALLVVGTLVEYLAWTVGLGAAVMTGLGRWAVVPPPVPPPSMSGDQVVEPSAVL